MAITDFTSILLIAISLSADCFAVALSGSMCMRTIAYTQVFRVSSAFGLFQAAMPAIGWLAGRTIIGLIAGYDHWAAFILLVIIGARMIWESLRSRDGYATNTDITRGVLLLTLSVATSIDALAVGLSFAFLKVDILMASLIIGAVAFVITAIGFFLGRRVGSLFGRRAKAAGGAVLIGIGFRILLAHLA